MQRFKLIAGSKSIQEAIVAVTGPALEIRIYHLLLEPFKADNNKLIFYLARGGELLAFETDLIIGNQEQIGHALRWYADQAGDPYLEFTTVDPRPAVN